MKAVNKHYVKDEEEKHYIGRPKVCNKGYKYKKGESVKKVNDWTQEEMNHFLALFMEKCWHEALKDKIVRVLHDAHFFGDRDIGEQADTILNFACNCFFSEIKSFMEKEYPKLWEEYLDNLCLWNDGDEGLFYTRLLNKQLSLSNLITFLLEPEQVREWGWVECAQCNGKGYWSGGSTNPNMEIACDLCGGKEEGMQQTFGMGKIKHQAMFFAEGLK